MYFHTGVVLTPWARPIRSCKIESSSWVGESGSTKAGTGVGTSLNPREEKHECFKMQNWHPVTSLITEMVAFLNHSKNITGNS